jgi:hypothetical protein
MPKLNVDPEVMRTAPKAPLMAADVDVIVWGDYMEPGTAEVDGMFRLFATPQKPNVRLRVHMQFPVNQAIRN